MIGGGDNPNRGNGRIYGSSIFVPFIDLLSDTISILLKHPDAASPFSKSKFSWEPCYL